MKDIIATNELVVRSYAQTVTGIQSTEQKRSENLVHPLPASTNEERSTIQLLDEYTDRGRRKNNLIIHNIPVSDDETFSDRNKGDTDKINNMISNVLGIDEVHILKTIRLGGRGQSRTTKPRLILATVDTPIRKRAILASAKFLRDIEDWKNIYISPDLISKEREEGRTLREALQERRLNGEVCIGIKGTQLLKLQIIPNKLRYNNIMEHHIRRTVQLRSLLGD